MGGLVGSILASAGARVLFLIRPESYAGHPATVSLESPLGHPTVPVIPTLNLEERVDVLWVTPKATHLQAALGAVPDPSLARMVVPLLNGVDHVAVLRSRFDPERVVPGTIACEVERAAPGRIVHRSPFARLAFSSAGEKGLAWAAEALKKFGCNIRFDADERTLLWRKLVMLAPMALNTTASALTVGELWSDPGLAARFEATAREACAVARGMGAQVDAEETLQMLRGMPGTLRSSMQKDVAAGRAPELDAIAGPILRGGRELGIPVPVTTALAAAVVARRPGPR